MPQSAEHLAALRRARRAARPARRDPRRPGRPEPAARRRARRGSPAPRSAACAAGASRPHRCRARRAARRADARWSPAARARRRRRDVRLWVDRVVHDPRRRHGRHRHAGRRHGRASATSSAARRPIAWSGARPAIARRRRTSAVARDGPGGGQPAWRGPRRRSRRGDALLTPEAWRCTAEIDVRLLAPGKVHQNLVLHLGSAAVPVRVRLLDDVHARIALTTPLPLRVGDRGLLRDPGEHRIAAGFDVLEVWPPPLTRRGAAAARAASSPARSTTSTVAASYRRPTWSPWAGRTRANGWEGGWCIPTTGGNSATGPRRR